jgi:hypothetical protein
MSPENADAVPPPVTSVPQSSPPLETALPSTSNPQGTSARGDAFALLALIILETIFGSFLTTTAGAVLGAPVGAVLVEPDQWAAMVFQTPNNKTATIAAPRIHLGAFFFMNSSLRVNETGLAP